MMPLWVWVERVGTNKVVTGTPLPFVVVMEQPLPSLRSVVQASSRAVPEPTPLDVQT